MDKRDLRQSSINESESEGFASGNTSRDTESDVSQHVTAKHNSNSKILLRKKSSHHDEDLTEFMAKEKKRKERKEIFHKLSYQSMIFFLCFVKLYFISLLQGVLTFQRQEFWEFDTDLKIAFIVGLLIFGNLIDNISTPKYLAIGIQFSIAVIWITTGLMVAYIIQREDEPGKLPDKDDIFYMFVRLAGSCQILAAGLVLINILQVYNWFT